jgi:glucose/arabinose dehydrogenase
MRNPRSLALPGLLLAAATAFAQSNAASAPSKVQWDSKYNIPVAPTGLAHRPLPDHPVVFDTAEGQNIRVVVVTKALEYPWSAVFLPDGSMLVSERTGQLRVIHNPGGNAVLDPKPVAGGPASFWGGQSGDPGAVHGYMDIALDPHFAENHLLYLTYTKPLDGGKRTTAVARGRWDKGALADVKDIFVLPEASTSRIAFGSDGMLYFTTTGKDPQDPNTLGGKVLRLRPDGSVPPDNPFVGQAGHRPEVYTLGHRSALGLALNPITGEMWQNENGPNGGDEINILKPGRNYGWPLVSYGRTYQGPWQVSPPGHPGFEPPVVIWIPAIAVSGMTFYTGDKFPKWKGDVFVGSLRTGEIPGTGHVERILFNDKWEELRREALLRELRQRIRDVRQGPDGLLYALTDDKEGAVLRIEPAE